MQTTSIAEDVGRERILIALANRQNEFLLGNALSPVFAVVRDLDRPDAFAGIDLCIVDGPTLHAHREAIGRARQDSEPLVLPVLMLSERRDVGLLSGELWRVVDDIIVRPIEKSELVARVRALLRMRRLSRQLERMASLYEQERRIAERLQVAALPHAFPAVAGLRFSAFYRPGSHDAQVGGDWYDVLRLPDGRVVVSVGDVAGSGLDAAVTMANLRQVIRGVSTIHADPAMVLDAADRTLQAEARDDLATAFVAVIDPVTRFVTYASAGHPPPLATTPDGIVEWRGGGLPLGVARGAQRETITARLPEASTVVFYTDGLTEATHDLEVGERRLHAALADERVLASANVASAVHDHVLPDGSRDDVAVFVVQTGVGAIDDDFLRWSFDVGDAHAARTARVEFSNALACLGISLDGLVAAETVFAELVGNVVRYAPGPIELVLDGTSRPVLHVLDRGPGFRFLPRLPIDLLAERGRGLYIIKELTEEFSVVLRPDGGSHARAVLGDGRGLTGVPRTPISIAAF